MISKLPVALVLVFAFTCVHAEDKHAAHWGYAGHAGAKHWGDMQPDFATCKIGRGQVATFRKLYSMNARPV